MKVDVLEILRVHGGLDDVRAAIAELIEAAMAFSITPDVTSDEIDRLRSALSAVHVLRTYPIGCRNKKAQQDGNS